MFVLPAEFETLLATFAPLFSRRVWSHARLLIVGAILAPGKRTVTSALRSVGLAREQHFTNYHRVLNRAVWNTCFAAKVLLGILVAILPSGFPLIVLVDETIERRNGKKIKTKGVFRDAVRSTRKQVVLCYGLRWVAMTLLVPVPWSRRLWALPFFTVQAPSQKTCEKLGKPHKTVIDRVCIMLRLVQRWVPQRTMVLIGDGAYAVVELIRFCRSLSNSVTLVVRFRWNAALYDQPGPPVPGKRGPKPKKGKRQPSLKERLADPSTTWERLSVRWYDGILKEVLAFSGTSLWHTPGMPPVLVRWVVVRDPQGVFEDTPILCTDLGAAMSQIIEWFVLRWNIEVFFEESRCHLGVETQRQWSDKAIGRTTPCLFGLFSLITVMAMRMAGEGRLPIAQTAWYRKEQATFSDVIAFVRRQLWAARYFVDSSLRPKFAEFGDDLIKQLIDSLAQAA